MVLQCDLHSTDFGAPLAEINVCHVLVKHTVTAVGLHFEQAVLTITALIRLSLDTQDVVVVASAAI